MVALFVCSTGRCGTQWLTKTFADSLGDTAVVGHEPLGPRWAPRTALRHPDLARLRHEMPEVDAHLKDVAATVAAGRHYVEAGWPAFAWFPYLKETLGPPFRWFHLVRDPLFVAGSYVTLRVHHPTMSDPSWHSMALVRPSDPGVFYGELAGEWESMTQFEKCLYHWLEVNRYGIELASKPGLAPVSTVKFEDLFAGDPKPMLDIYAASGLPAPASIDLKPVDRFRGTSRDRPKITSQRLWRAVNEVASHFGYELGDMGLAASGRAVWRRYSWAGRGSTGLKRVRRIVKASLLGVIGR